MKTVLLAAVALLFAGCAMSPTRVARLSPAELCVDNAEALLQGGFAVEGAMQTKVNQSDILSALAHQGVNCYPNRYEWMRIAQMRIQNRQVANANLVAGLTAVANADAALMQASKSEPLVAPVVPVTVTQSAPVFNGRPIQSQQAQPYVGPAQTPSVPIYTPAPQPAPTPYVSPYPSQQQQQQQLEQQQAQETAQQEAQAYKATQQENQYRQPMQTPQPVNPPQPRCIVVNGGTVCQ